MEETQKKEFGKAFKSFIDSYLYPTEFNFLFDKLDIQNGLKEFLEWEAQNAQNQLKTISNPPRIIVGVSGAGKTRRLFELSSIYDVVFLDMKRTFATKALESVAKPNDFKTFQDCKNYTIELIVCKIFHSWKNSVPNLILSSVGTKSQEIKACKNFIPVFRFAKFLAQLNKAVQIRTNRGRKRTSKQFMYQHVNILDIELVK